MFRFYDKIVIEYLSKMKRYYAHYDIQDLKLLRIRSEASNNMFNQSSYILTIIAFLISIISMVFTRLFNENKINEMKITIFIGLLALGVIILSICVSHFIIHQRKLIIEDLIKDLE